MNSVGIQSIEFEISDAYWTAIRMSFVTAGIFVLFVWQWMKFCIPVSKRDK